MKENRSIDFQVKQTDTSLSILPKLNGKNLGYATVFISDASRIMDFVVGPGERNKGIGSSMLTIFELRLRRAKSTSIGVNLGHYSKDGIQLTPDMGQLADFLIRKGFERSQENPLFLTKSL